MAINENQIWAADIELTQPSVGKISNGFECGDADPDIFNWLFNAYGQAIYENQQALNNLTDTTTQNNSNLAERVNSVESKTRSAQRFISNDNPGRQGIVSLADSIHMVGAAGTQGATFDTKSVITFARYFSAMFRLFQDNDSEYNNWEDITSYDENISEGIWGYIFESTDNMKGIYIVTVTDTRSSSPNKTSFTFDVFFNAENIVDRMGETKNDTGGNLHGSVSVRCGIGIGAKSITFYPGDGSGSAAAGVEVTRVERLNMIDIRSSGTTASGTAIVSNSSRT